MKLKTGLGLALTAAAGYGAWTMYKKYNPSATQDIKRAVGKMTKQAEHNIESMM